MVITPVSASRRGTNINKPTWDQHQQADVAPTSARITTVRKKKKNTLVYKVTHWQANTLYRISYFNLPLTKTSRGGCSIKVGGTRCNTF